MDLTGKVAIVTGNGRGLGAAIRERMIDAGAIAPTCTHRNCDVTSFDSIYDFVAMVDETFGRIDVLVNNAAVLGHVCHTAKLSSQKFGDTLTANLIAPTKLMGLVFPAMVRCGGGKIINIAGGGATDPLPRRVAYAASKAALVRVTESIAEEYASAKIDVNAVLPGPMPTAMYDEIIAAGPHNLGEEEFEEHTGHVFDGTEIDRAAALCVYLASSESDGITGKTISARYDPWPFDAAHKATLMSSNQYTLRRVGEAHAPGT